MPITLFAVSLPLKIWNTTRYEKKFEEQQRLLMPRRGLPALTSQINPHFLFNTLNSVSSLIRTTPDAGARHGLEAVQDSAAAAAQA